MMNGKSKSARNVNITSRAYQTIKENDAAVRSMLMSGDGNHNYGVKFGEDFKEKIRGPRPQISGDKNPNYGKKTSKDTIFIANYVRAYSYYAVDVDYSVMDLIHKSCGIKTGKAKNRILKTKGLLDLARHYRGIQLGNNTIERGISGDKNPNYGNGQAIIGDKNPMYGKQHTKSTKEKIGAKAKRTITCPHCDKIGNIANMHRWHLDNCRFKK